MAPSSAKKPTFFSKLRSKLSCGPTFRATKKKLPCRAFAIGTKVLNLNELNADGVPTNNLRYVRDSQYSEPQKKWLYQLNGRDYKNSAGWVPEDALRRYPLDEENLSIAQVAVLGMGRELR